MRVSFKEPDEGKKGKPLKLGGAIKQDVRKMDLYTPAMDFKTILRDRAMLKGEPRPQQYLHGVIDFIPRNQIGFHQYGPEHVSENELHHSLLKVVSGGGAKEDHPTVVQTVYETLKHIPELAHAYMHF